MGYYTYFSLEMLGDEAELEKVRNFKADDTMGFSDYYYVNGILDDNEEHDYKWYDWEKDMRILASMFPEILFILDGDGEETDDSWQFRIKGKVSEHHYVEMPPFTTPELMTEYEKNNKR